MRLDVWLALGAGLALAVAAVVQGSALRRSGPGRRRWEWLATGARCGGSAALTAAIILAAIAHGQWSPSDLRQVILGLALAILVVYLGLAWSSGASSAGPVVDLVTLVLILVDVIVVWPGGPLLTSAQATVPFQVQWTLFLLGGGAVTVAGSAGLMLVLQPARPGSGNDLRWMHATGTHILLRQATSVALLALGSGLAVSVWWAWRTVGFLTDGDPRVGWVAITWLAAAMSELAWWWDRRSPVSDEGGGAGRWAAGLAIVAAAGLLFGLLAVMDLRHFLGT
jgi:hypothetical protein